MKKDKPISYKQFLKQPQISADNTDLELISNLLVKAEPLIQSPLPFSPAIFAIDYRTRQYLFWKNSHNGFGGYTPDFFMNEGHQGVLDNINSLHLNVVSDKICPNTLDALQLATSEQQIISSFNYKGKALNGKEFMVYQRCMYILNIETGLPSYCVGVGMDINSFKKDNFISHTIESLDTTSQQIKLLQEVTYNPEPEVYFTPKETLIIHYLLDGLSSKQIGDKMHISVNTVNNHRQNILKKTSCNNVAQLMAFVLRAGLK